jgi:hypothetical protein
VTNRFEKEGKLLLQTNKQLCPQNLLKQNVFVVTKISQEIANFKPDYIIRLKAMD